MAVAYGWLAGCALAGAGCFGYLVAAQPAAPPRAYYKPLLQKFCQQTVDGPTEQWACTNLKVYTFQGGRWNNGFGATPVPWTPAR